MEPIKTVLAGSGRLVITPDEAADILRNGPLKMRVSADTIRDGLRSGVFTFGDFIPNGGDRNCEKGKFPIYRKLLDHWVADRI